MAVFAIPGDKDQLTGGYIYDAAVLRGLNASGCRTQHLPLPDSFPEPTPADRAQALAALCAVPKAQPIVIDGLALGAMDAAELSRVPAPIIAMVHHPLGLESGLSPARAEALMRNEAQTLAQAAHVMVPSRHIAQTLRERFGVEASRISVASPGFARPGVAAEPATPPRILSVGLLARRKGHDVLLEALAQLADLDWQAEIIGRAHDRDFAQMLRTECARLGLSQRVTFKGEVGSDALQRAYQRASIFALATRYEGYGMVLSEAMLNGLPVVSCRVGAVPETVGGAGHLVPPDDPDAFAAALRLILQDRSEADRLRRAAALRAEALPGWEETTRHFLEIIRKVAA